MPARERGRMRKSGNEFVQRQAFKIDLKSIFFVIKMVSLHLCLCSRVFVIEFHFSPSPSTQCNEFCVRAHKHTHSSEFVPPKWKYLPSIAERRQVHTTVLNVIKPIRSHDLDSQCIWAMCILLSISHSSAVPLVFSLI